MQCKAKWKYTGTCMKDSHLRTRKCKDHRRTFCTFSTCQFFSRPCVSCEGGGSIEMNFKEEGGDEVKRGRLHDVRKETLFYTFVLGARYCVRSYFLISKRTNNSGTFLNGTPRREEMRFWQPLLLLPAHYPFACNLLKPPKPSV